jgi:transcription termination factor Rho
MNSIASGSCARCSIPNTVDSMELLIDKIKEAQSNSEFLASMNS